MLRTPFGKPISFAHSAMMREEKGAFSDDLRTRVLPVMRAGAIFMAAIVTGTFQGMIAPHTPYGWRKEMLTMLAVLSEESPQMESAFPAKYRRIMSPVPVVKSLCVGLPIATESA